MIFPRRSAEVHHTWGLLKIHQGVYLLFDLTQPRVDGRELKCDECFDRLAVSTLKGDEEVMIVGTRPSGDQQGHQTMKPLNQSVLNGLHVHFKSR